MLTYSFGSAASQVLAPKPYLNSKYTLEYNPPIQEFSILKTSLKDQSETIQGIHGPSILIVTSGKGSICNGAERVEISVGSCFFISQNTTAELTGTLDCYRAFCTMESTESTKL